MFLALIRGDFLTLVLLRSGDFLTLVLLLSALIPLAFLGLHSFVVLTSAIPMEYIISPLEARFLMRHSTLDVGFFLALAVVCVLWVFGF